MSPVKMNPLLSTAAAETRPAGASKVRDAAEQFEALLLGQILRTAREGNRSSSDCATEFAEQHLATVLSQRGGLGLARLIGQGLGAQKFQA